jgi:hypothetical protein
MQSCNRHEPINNFRGSCTTTQTTSTFKCPFYSQLALNIKEYKDNKGSAISCLYSIAGRTGGGQATAACARDVSRTRHSHLASREMLNLH